MDVIKILELPQAEVSCSTLLIHEEIPLLEIFHTVFQEPQPVVQLPHIGLLKRIQVITTES